MASHVTGPSYWPCTRFFTLASLDAKGDTDGGGADVCRECVIKVAVDALYVMEEGTFGYEAVTRSNLQDGRGTTAVETCGPAPAYDIWGETSVPTAGRSLRRLWTTTGGGAMSEQDWVTLEEFRDYINALFDNRVLRHTLVIDGDPQGREDSINVVALWEEALEFSRTARSES